MSTKGIRDFRPELHFSPKTGWTNDPNGLVYENGRYHLFYQHNPDDTVWGPMHWGHASSADLLHWEHHPIVMAPDELGMIFSGSAVCDIENTAGFGKDGKTPIVAMFTHHHHTETGDDYEQQSIAYSLDDGMTFTMYEGNPVIPSRMRDFRDPKVFRNEQKGCWGMVLAAGDRVHFYASKDLKSWEKTGEFGPEGNYSEGVWECPDLFPLEVSGETRWVLMVSMGPNEANHGGRVQYFIGAFDGDTFTPDGRFTAPEFIDSGFDNYAAVTYYNTDERILVGWGDNPVYAGDTPTNEFCCVMTAPRVLSLVDTPLGGVRLAGRPVTDNAFDEGTPSDGTLPGEVFKLTVTGEGPCTVTLSNEAGQQFTFGVNEANEAFIDRSKAGARDFNPLFGSDWYSVITAPRFYEGGWKLELTFDHSAAELFLDNGTRVFSQVLFPDAPFTSVSADHAAEIRVHVLK
ncbi:MAG: glycoside hydrolase family 32 protein [Oscillospiraceae bacterium]|nr:glycoside hydrolase family 32 protein [Oscillospiraceae bacterium]